MNRGQKDLKLFSYQVLFCQPSHKILGNLQKLFTRSQFIGFISFLLLFWECLCNLQKSVLSGLWWILATVRFSALVLLYYFLYFAGVFQCTKIKPLSQFWENFQLCVHGLEEKYVVQFHIKYNYCINHHEFYSFM